MTVTKTSQHLCIQQIYTDGACSGNPGKGGWGTVLYFNDRSVYELGGMEPETTNNRMEMQAAIAGLEFLAQSQQTQSVTLYTDSEYVKNGITQWIRGWKNKNWKTSTGKPRTQSRFVGNPRSPQFLSNSMGIRSRSFGK